MLSNMKIKAKCILVTAIMILCFAGYAVFSTFFSQQIAINGPMYKKIVSNKDLVADILPPPAFLIEAYLVAKQLQDNNNEGKRQALVEKLANLEKDYHSRHDFWTSELPASSLRDLFLNESYAPGLQMFRIINTDFVAAIRKNDKEATKKADAELTQAFEHHRLAIDKVVAEATKLSSAIEGESEALQKKISIGIIIGTAIMVGFITFLTWSTSSAILMPIKMLVGFFKDLAQGEGDLRKRVAIKSGDEIGELAKLFNIFMENLQVMIKEIAQKSLTLQASSHSLSGIAGQMARRVDDINGRSNQVATAAEEMSANLNNVAAASEQAATNVHIIATASEEMTATVGEIAQNSGRAKEISEKAVINSATASSKVNELGEAALQISKVTEVITEISEQTNLLALNATIEAARAGEAGKGFAVVANEIKELARQTVTATQQIKGRIEGIQLSTDQTVDQISKISKVIEEVNGIVSSIATAVDEQSASSQEISNNIAQASQGINEVNENVNQSSAVSASISADLAGVHQGVQDISFNSSQVEASAKDLAELAKQLQLLIGCFKTD